MIWIHVAILALAILACVQAREINRLWSTICKMIDWQTEHSNLGRGGRG